MAKTAHLQIRVEWNQIPRREGRVPETLAPGSWRGGVPKTLARGSPRGGEVTFKFGRSCMKVQGMKTYFKQMGRTFSPPPQIGALYPEASEREIYCMRRTQNRPDFKVWKTRSQGSDRKKSDLKLKIMSQ